MHIAGQHAINLCIWPANIAISGKFTTVLEQIYTRFVTFVCALKERQGPDRNLWIAPTLGIC